MNVFNYMKNDASTQVNFEPQIIIDLKLKNHKLEQLSYNTRFNSGKISELSKDIQSVTETDELICLRQEFKNVIIINKKLLKALHASKINIDNNNDDVSYYPCCCIII